MSEPAPLLLAFGAVDVCVPPQISDELNMPEEAVADCGLELEAHGLAEEGGSVAALAELLLTLSDPKESSRPPKPPAEEEVAAGLGAGAELKSDRISDLLLPIVGLFVFA